ncbi:MAG TPA: hypothetical protein VJN43_13150 [Bryobacteraceae bacterium]|nr:hypothetical protein [Bryobacteraceae bacterium]
MEEKQQATAQPQQGCFFCTVAGPQIEQLLSHCWPEPTQEHFRNARVEVLKGIRSLLDARIERLSQHAQKGTKVNVD